MMRIIILGAGEMQVPVIRRARELGFFTIVVDFDVKAPGFSIADEKALISTLDLEGILQLAKAREISGILTTSDFPVNMVAKVAQVLGLKAMTPEVAKLCTNKFLQREFFRTNQIKTPQFKLITNSQQLEDVDYFPVIIKPVDSSASRGVKMVRNMVELKAQFESTMSYSKEGASIVEEYIPGSEFSVETFTQEGVTKIIAITEKKTKGEDRGYFVEDTHIIPARISDQEYKLICSEVQRAIDVMKIDNCPTHTEVKLNKEGAFIIEMACRLGGDYIASDLVPLATGIDMLGNLVLMALGKKINTEQKWNKISAIQFLNEVNYKKCINFIERGNSAIVRAEVKKYHADEIDNSLQRMGYVILQANSIEEMDHLLMQLN